jgi:hypothetical protein
MKALLRTSIIALIVFAGYAAMATDLGTPQAGPIARPWQCPPSSVR